MIFYDAITYHPILYTVLVFALAYLIGWAHRDVQLEANAERLDKIAKELRREFAESLARDRESEPSSHQHPPENTGHF